MRMKMIRYFKLQETVGILCTLCSQRTEEFAVIATPAINTYTDAVCNYFKWRNQDIEIRFDTVTCGVSVIRQIVGKLLFHPHIDVPEISQALQALFTLKLLFLAETRSDLDLVQNIRLRCVDRKTPTQSASHAFVRDILWDTEDQSINECNLPEEVLVLDLAGYTGDDLQDRLSNLLSDKFGFCHHGFDYQVIDAVEVLKSGYCRRSKPLGVIGSLA